ncbi:MAG: ribonuclease [Ignavibacteria bacterium]|nr:ribonuclease [Ignavibacteria bacterium]
MMKTDKISIYTDGACSGNPGPGGWAAIIKNKDKEIEISGAEIKTTNNRMELTAVIEALGKLKPSAKTIPVEVYTDSRYVSDAFNKFWISSWKKKNWLKNDKKEVPNKDLWIELDSLTNEYNVKYFWLEGHAGHEFNERCDQMAREAIKELDNPATLKREIKAETDSEKFENNELSHSLILDKCSVQINIGQNKKDNFAEILFSGSEYNFSLMLSKNEFKLFSDFIRKIKVEV